MDEHTFGIEKRVTRTPEEMRDVVITFRTSRQEMNELYHQARSRTITMSYMIREALEKAYPEVFANANRHIKKPRKQKPIQPRTHIMHSFVDGTVNILGSA